MTDDALATQLHNSPPQHTMFVGRERELQELRHRLLNPACRLLTVVGPGGMGKSRLALQVAAQLADSFAGGAYFISLQPAQESEFLLMALLDGLGLVAANQEEPLALLRSFLADQALLLLLDNFETQLAEAPLLSELLAGNQVKILVTSRQTLNLVEEWIYPLQGLSYPGPEPAGSELSSYGAVALFANRARQHRPDFDLAQEADGVCRVCQLVEGMPLALELAASWIRSMSSGEIAAEIGRSRELLTTRWRNMPERHRSLSAVIAQSWATLTPPEQALFARLSIFRAGFKREAAEAVAGATLPLLSTLLDKSLLYLDTGSSGAGRYQIHELLRQYGSEQLALDAEAAHQTGQRHCRYFAARLAGLLDDLYGRDQVMALRAIESELHEFRSAWSFTLAEAEWALLDQMVEPLHQFYAMKERLPEGIALFGKAVAALQDSMEPEARPLWGRLVVRYRFMQIFIPADPEAMAADLAQGLALAYESGAELEIGLALMAAGGYATYVLRDIALAEERFTAALAHFQSQRSGLLQARCLVWLGAVQTEPEVAKELAQESLAVARACGDKVDMLISLANLAESALEAGENELALSYSQEAVSTADDVRLPVVSAYARSLLSLIQFLNGDFEEAAILAEESLQRARAIHSAMSMSYAEACLALCWGVRGAHAPALQLAAESRQHHTEQYFSQIIAAWATAVAQCGLNVPDEAWRELAMAARLAAEVQSPTMLAWLWPVAAVVLAQAGHQEMAEQLHLMLGAESLPATKWCEGWPLFVAVVPQVTNQRPAAISAADVNQWLLSLASAAELLPLPMVDAEEQANQALPDPLTEREVEVLHLVASGLTNRQIATELILSRGTVKYYTSQIYSKLGVSNRTQAVAQARELGLLGD